MMSEAASEGRAREADVMAGAELRARHRSNPNGTWRTIGALTERPNRQWLVEALIGGVWRRVQFSSAPVNRERLGGHRVGAGRKPSKNKKVSDR